MVVILKRVRVVNYILESISLCSEESPSSDGGAEWGVREEKIVFAALKPLLDKERNVEVSMEVGMPRF